LTAAVWKAATHTARNLWEKLGEQSLPQTYNTKQSLFIVFDPIMSILLCKGAIAPVFAGHFVYEGSFQDKFKGSW